MSVNATPEAGSLRALRRAAGISQQQLAQEARCSLSMVRLLERGYEPERGSTVLPRIVAILSNEKGPAAEPAPSDDRRVGGEGVGTP